MAQHNATHPNYTWQAFSFLGPGVVHLFPYWNLSNKHVQGQNRSIPVGLRVNILLLKSTSCCFFILHCSLELSLSFATFLEVCVCFNSHCFPSPLMPTWVHMKSYNWWKCISVTSCEANYHLEPQIDSLFRNAIYLWIHKPCCRKKKSPNPQIPQII